MNIKNITVAIVTCVLSLGLTSINVEAKSKLTIPLDDSFHSVDYPFNSGGGVFTLVKIIEQDDKLYLCGVAHISGVETVFGQQLMGATYLKLNDVEILRNTRFFKTVHKSKIKRGMQAHCKQTKAKAPFPKDRTYTFDLKQTRFRD